MAESSDIEWTDATWNPVTGCRIVSPGCTNCYAMRLAGTRLQHHPSRAGLTRDSRAGPVWTGEIRFNEQWLDQPLRWKRPRRIFVCAHGDLFAEGVTEDMLDRIFAVMARSKQHIFQVLTKRPETMRKTILSMRLAFLADIAMWKGETLSAKSTLTVKWRHLASALRHAWSSPGLDPQAFPLPNVWLGVSVEDQDRARRVADLMHTPAAIRFVSAEPLLGPVDFTAIDVDGWSEMDALSPWSEAEIWRDCWQPSETGVPLQEAIDDFVDEGFSYPPSETRPPGLDWIIVGGESGPNARPMHPAWVRAIRDQCQAADVPLFFKQWGSYLPWEPGPPPEWCAQDGQRADRSDLFPADIADDPPGWRSGLDFLHESDCAFQRVGKKRAGRLLDGRLHDAFPRLTDTNEARRSGEVV